MHNNVEMRLRVKEQIPRERYRKKRTQFGQLSKEVRKQSPSGGPDIILSRADNAFLAKLLKLKFPEIYDRLINIKAIAREPGERAKVAVQSFDDRIDPGRCVRWHEGFVFTPLCELSNEKY